LDEFEAHAFAGLEQSQYHLFAVLHTDDDGSKHIHVLTPRIDLESGKSLNIAPPGHEKHFDSLRDYFNTKYEWSRPDDVLLMRTTQEPNHIAKLNKQAKNILSSDELETLTKKQFCSAIDNYVKTLLKTQMAENRADIIKCIEQLDGIDSIKQSKEFLTVTLENGKKHRLKGDFYHEQFEIRSYSEHLRAAAASRASSNELAQSLKDAEQLRANYRAKREAYHQQHYAFAASAADDNRARIASKRDFERDRELITPSDQIANSELYGANRRTHSAAIEYRYIDNQISANTHRVVFNISADIAKRDQQQNREHRNRSADSEQNRSNTDTASIREEHNNRLINRISDQERAREEHNHRRNDSFYILDFNMYLYGLSNIQKRNDTQHTRRNDQKQRNNFAATSRSTQSELTEILVDENRNRSIFGRAKQLIDATKRIIDSTSQFIAKHRELSNRNRAELAEQNQILELRERDTRNRNLEIRKQLADSITTAIDASIHSTQFKQHYQQFSQNSVHTDSTENHFTAKRTGTSTLADLTAQSIRDYVRRAEHQDQQNRANTRKFNNINQELERLETAMQTIRLKPSPAQKFISLRSDGYYSDYVGRHKQLTTQQDTAFRAKNHLQLIDSISKKAENLHRYMSRASNMLDATDYALIKRITKNDERMLKYLKCELILEPQNAHLSDQRENYTKCLSTFESIKNRITAIEDHKSEKRPVQQFEQEKPKPKHDFDLDF
uniref:mobilization protein n=1 Tax=Acinetobacter brisouii TaxID=396323 RepID=UPI00148F0466